MIQACKALQRGDVEAVVYDKTILGHMIKDYGWHELDVLPQTLAIHDYAMPCQAAARSESRSTALCYKLFTILHGKKWYNATLRPVIILLKGGNRNPFIESPDSSM